MFVFAFDRLFIILHFRSSGLSSNKASSESCGLQLLLSPQPEVHEVVPYCVCVCVNFNTAPINSRLLIKRVQILTRRNDLQPRFEDLTQRMHTQCSKSYLPPSPFIGQHKYWWGRCLPCQTNDALRHRPVQWKIPQGWDQSEPVSRGESEPAIVLLEATARRQRAKERQLLVKRSLFLIPRSWIHCMQAISESQWACVTYKSVTLYFYVCLCPPGFSLKCWLCVCCCLINTSVETIEPISLIILLIQSG